MRKQSFKLSKLDFVSVFSLETNEHKRTFIKVTFKIAINFKFDFFCQNDGEKNI